MPSVLAAAACYNFCGRWQQTVADSFRYLSFHQSNGRHSQWVESERESRGRVGSEVEAQPKKTFHHLILPLQLPKLLCA